MQSQYIPLPYRAENITGQRFGRLVALGPIEKNIRTQIIWLCRCDCGNTTSLPLSRLRNGHTKSCGCIHREMMRVKATRHGMVNDPLYGTWNNMLHRCANTNAKEYHRYGGRGIIVCDEWQHDFKAFHDCVIQLLHCGEKGYTLDRINNDGNYEPDNVRWATRKEQSNNSTKVTLITYNGKTQCISDWERELGINPGVLAYRIHQGWTTQQSMETPVQKKSLSEIL